MNTMLCIDLNIGLCGMVWLSGLDKQNRKRDFMFSSFKKGLIAFECRRIIPFLWNLMSDVLLISNACDRDLKVVCFERGISRILSISNPILFLPQFLVFLCNVSPISLSWRHKLHVRFSWERYVWILICLPSYVLSNRYLCTTFSSRVPTKSRL